MSNSPPSGPVQNENGEGPSTSSCASAANTKRKNTEMEIEPVGSRRILPESFFTYLGPSKVAEGNSMYRCVKCLPKQIGNVYSCNDRSRQNLRKHIAVSTITTTSL